MKWKLTALPQFDHTGTTIATTDITGTVPAALPVGLWDIEEKYILYRVTNALFPSTTWDNGITFTRGSINYMGNLNGYYINGAGGLLATVHDANYY